MKNTQKYSLSLAGVFSLAFFYLYIEIGTSAPFWQFLTLEIPITEIAKQAETKFNQLQNGEVSNTPDIEFNFDEELLLAVQAQDSAIARTNDFQVAWIDVDYQRSLNENEEIKIGDGENKKQVLYSWKYNTRGEEIGFSLPYIRDSGNLQKIVAADSALIFLAQRGIDTSRVEMAGYKQEKKEDRVDHLFTFESPVDGDSTLVRSLEIKFMGNQITHFATDYEIKTDATEKAGEKWQKYTLIILIVGFWVFIIVFVSVSFVRRLRRDELDLKRGTMAGASMFVLSFAMIAISAYPSKSGIFIGGFFGALFTSIGFLILFVTSHSIARASNPDKVETADLIIGGSFNVREIGVALLRALFFAGICLVVLAGMQWLVTTYFDVQCRPEGDDLWILDFRREAIAGALGKIVQAAFLAWVLFVYFPAAVKSRIVNKNYVSFILMLAFLVFMQNLFFEPELIGFIVALPAAALAVYVVLRFDLLTSILFGFLFYVISDFKYVNLDPQGLADTYGLIMLFGGVFVVALAEYLLFRGRPASDLEHYVPEYVSRIAERQRMLQELAIAREVQKRFLPAHVPDFPGLQIAAICTPAMEVGGDYYDFMKMDDTRYGVVIGDVSGKGVSAAFYMTMAKGIIHTLARKTWQPREILNELNEVFFANSPREVFISVIWGVFDIGAKKLSFARAGHNPLIMHKNQAKEPEFLSPKGLGIGLASGDVFSKTTEEVEIPITSGDVFIFYTDGISEAMSHSGEEFGEDRLRSLVNQHAHLSAEKILESIKSEIDIFAGTAPQHDDFTMVVVKVVD
ncbi:MAG: hypothetical protein DWQ10_08680 [Calditrichaeota bacterium]|nr:MAG: hypothetical protein DWQ10_08680 [Calditrichota bacterium]